MEGDSPSYVLIARWLLVAFVDDTSDQQDLPILTAFDGFITKSAQQLNKNDDAVCIYNIYAQKL